LVKWLALFCAGKDTVVLNHRRGFVRLALSYGADIVPTYGFGVTDMYNTYSFAKKFRNFLSKQYQIALPLFSGRWLTMTPYPSKVTVCVYVPVCERLSESE
jgi:hypothetical protein